MAHADTEPEALSERLALEMAQRWRQGERPTAEEYLNRYPELWVQPEAAADLIYEEVCLRQERGEADAAADALRRFPQWRGPLEVLLGFHDLLEPAAEAPAFPTAGETLGEFTLLTELGRGASGRVFLASQPSLAERLVVLKVTACAGAEHLSLARLQHTNIVPLHSAQDDTERNLRVLCMPYVGGVTLARLLERLAKQPLKERAGRLLLAEIDQERSAGAVALPTQGAARHFLTLASYTQAMCALGAQLADALHYAHEHGLIHLDVKPSNVLLAADGQAMLLDFHLARAPIQADTPVPPWLGGTLHYLSPEQQTAMASLRAGAPASVAIDGRSDVYSLGLVLYQALGGPVPPPSDVVPPRLESCNPQASVGLADIIHRCLAPAAGDRYASADLLAADLRRHLADLPLRGVANRSLRERWGKWGRRRPHAFRLVWLGAAVLLLAIACVLGGLTVLGSRRAEARALIDFGFQLRRQGDHAGAAQALQHSLLVIRDLPWHGALIREIRTELKVTESALAAERQRAQWQLTAHDLNVFVDRIRYLYGAQPLPPSGLETLRDNCRRWWERRQQLMGSDEPLANGALKQQIADDLLDLVVLWMDLPPPTDKEGAGGAARAALDVLREAEAEFGPSAVLERQRYQHAMVLGLHELATAARRRSDELPPRTAWEHYALGRLHMRAGEVDEAAACLHRAVTLQPEGLWPNFYDGVCAYRQARYDDAVVAFSACVALAPHSGECCFNRGLAYAKLGRLDRARPDLARARQLNPELQAPGEFIER